MKKNYRILAIALALLMTASACGAKEETPAPAPAPAPIDTPVSPKPQAEPEPAPQPEPEPEPELEKFYSPLSGLETEADLSANRPFAVMINNHKSAQPLMSVSKADIIYEYIAEGGITRLLAIFQSLDGVGTVGTVRSARPYYLETVLGYDAIYVHAGGSDDAYAKLASWKMDHLDGVRGGADANIFWRDAWRKSNKGYEHSLVTSGENIQNFVDKSSIRKTHKEGYDAGLTFGETSAAAEGTDAKKVTVKVSSYKTGVYEYDEESKKYLANQYGAPLIDGDTEEQLAVKNLLVLNTTSKVVDDYGRMSYVTTGENKGTYYCEGKSIAITWSRSDKDDVFRYKTEDGKDLTLMPGNTYITMLNGSGSVSVQ